MPFSALQVASHGDSWWVENSQMFCPSSWNTGVMLGISRKVQACQCREGYRANLSERIFKHIKDKMAIGESQYSLAKTKWYLVNLAALCDESTGSRDQGRTENVFCLYWGFLQDLPFIPRETGEMWIGEIDSMVHQKWTVLWGSEVCDQWEKPVWHPIATKCITGEGMRQASGKESSFAEKT